ncbi:MAG: alpha/beta hydrolase [Pseudolabrys sp.]
MPTLKWLVIVAVVAYAAVVALLYVFQRSLMYFPDTRRTPPAAAGLPQAREIELTAADGTRLVAWHVAPAEGRPLVLYFHGNGGALNLRARRFGRIFAPGNGLLALSYRSYGGSAGAPSEPGLIADAGAAYDYAAREVPAERIVIFGESLGSAVAVALAAERKAAGMILDAPFTAAVDVAAAVYPFVPVRWLMKDQFNSAARIGKVDMPLLVLHGERDHVIPISFGEKLFALAREPKRMVRFPNGTHVDLDDHGATAEILKFLDSVAR